MVNLILMKYLVFIRGDDSPLRDVVARNLMLALNPNINTVRAIKVSMNDYGPITNKGERKAAASSAKKLVRKLLSGSHQEKFILIDNPNLQPSNWAAFFNIAHSVEVQVLGVGIDVNKNEQSASETDKNEQDPNLTMFIATMYKYVQVENEQDIDLAISTLLELDKR